MHLAKETVVQILRSRGYREIEEIQANLYLAELDDQLFDVVANRDGTLSTLTHTDDDVVVDFIVEEYADDVIEPLPVGVEVDDIF